MKVAIYVRVSKDVVSSSGQLQDPTNQIEPLKKYAEARGWEVHRIYIDRMSGGAANRPRFREMMDSISGREFDHILVWSLDRFSREGITSTLAYMKKLKFAGVGITSLQEPWMNIDDEGIGQLLLSLWAWLAKEERRKISERTKAGLARVKRAGKKLGRPVGSKDKKRRKKSGYYMYHINKNKGGTEKA